MAKVLDICVLFTESSPRLIQYISRNVHLYVVSSPCIFFKGFVPSNNKNYVFFANSPFDCAIGANGGTKKKEKKINKEKEKKLNEICYSIGANICIGRESWGLPYTGFF